MFGPMMRELLTFIPAQGWLGIAGGLAFVVAYSVVTRQRALALVRRWAALHRLTIISANQRTFVPFMTPAKGQFFRVRLTDSSGATKQCWLRFTDWTAIPDDIQVDWDDKTEPGGTVNDLPASPPDHH